MSQQNMPYRSGGSVMVSVLATTTATQLTSLIETMLGLTAGSLATIFREVQIQVDPEVSGGASVRFGSSNVGQTLNGVVQKGITITGGGADTWRGPANNVHVNTIFVQSVSATAVLNCQLWSE
jgi:hypothetical protein